jgi:hypothetical protein
VPIGKEGRLASDYGFHGFHHLTAEDNPFANVVGALIMNHGGVELLSVLWINSLARDPLLAGEANRQPFARRCDLIRQLVDRTEMDPAKKEEADAVWQEAKKMAEFRNKVAHNPLMLGWSGGKPAGKGPPDVVCIVDLRSAKGTQVDAIGREEIRQRITAVHRLGSRIEALGQDFGVKGQISPE